MEGSYSFQTGRIPAFHTVDYVVFGLLLGLSAAIGLYYAIKDKVQKKENTEEFLLGGRSMSIFPVAMSLTVTFLSALTILGNPAEVYNYNTMFLYITVAMVIAMILSGIIFIPFFLHLGITSIFQYLEMRFSPSVRLLGSTLMLVQTVIYMAFVLYAPSLALSAVTGINLWGCLVGVGVVVTFYTTLGGMKAVLWTDTLQFVMIVAGLLAVFIQGCRKVGGFQAAWQKTNQRGRIVFDEFSFDPATRHSFWSVAVGGAVMWTALYGVNQAQVQRCMSTSSVRRAQLAILLNTPGLIGILALACLTGVILFAFYADCHPLPRLVSSADQLLPLFVMDILGDMHGLPGLFVSCVFSGSLSSLSSCLNAVSAVVYKDFCEPYCCKRLSEFSATLLNKLLVLVFGCLSMALSYVVSQMGGMMQATYAVYGLLNGPFFGLFILGMFFPWANKWGAIVGLFTSLAIMSWIGIGTYINKVSTVTLSPVSLANCTWLHNIADLANNSWPHSTADLANSSTTTAAAATVAAVKRYEGVDYIYTLSYMYYTAVGVAILVGVALLVSCVTGLTRPASLDPRLICPIFETLFPCLPECILRPLRFGIVHKGKYEQQKQKKVDAENGISNGIKKNHEGTMCTIYSEGIDNVAFSPDHNGENTKL